MRKTHFDIINERMSDIRNSIQAHQTEVDRQISKYFKQVEDDTARLNEATLSFENKKNRMLCQSAVRFSADQAIQSINIAFDDITDEINEWSIETPGNDYLTLMETVSRFSLPLSVAEIEVLSKSAAGSYFGEKLLAKFAEKAGLKYPFEELSALSEMIRNCRKDCVLAVSAYCGDAKGNIVPGWVTDEIGAFQSHHRIFAIDFLSRDSTSLTRLADALSTATDSTITLLESEQKKMEKYFDGVSPEDRYDRMQDLIVHHPEIERQLRIYDPDCFAKAKAEIRNKAEQERQNALDAVREASSKAVAAQKALVSMA